VLLKNKIAVITGDPYGVGQAAALLFASEGASVICIDDKPAWENFDEVRRKNASAAYFHADVTDSRQLQDVVRECEKIVERADILFNLAGRAFRQSFEATTEATWETMVGRNLTATFLCSKYFLPLMKKAGSGAIINHGSIDASLGNPAIAAYSAAKGGVIPLTHVMAHDLAKYRIRVNCISTGGIRGGKDNSRGEDEVKIASTPSQRLGTPEDVARVGLFLACDWSSYVNGANIVVDGGRSTITQGCYDAN
jgi:NAD(P)-dependent dehydrogenase (short-subunit alcohol dehydrogenase family)